MSAETLRRAAQRIREDWMPGDVVDDTLLAVADQLEREGVAWQQVAADHPDLAEAIENNITKSGWLAVARTYLGDTP
jgi:hypothetical protein